MLTFKSLVINYVDISREMLTSVLTLKLLIINVVDLVDICMRYYHLGRIVRIADFETDSLSSDIS